LAAATALGTIQADSAEAVIVDANLTSTTQIRTATNNPVFGAGDTLNMAGVNFYFTNTVAAGSSLNGVFFDNVSMGPPSGGPPVAPVNLAANGPGVTLTVSTPGTRYNEVRNQTISATGPDAAVLNQMARDITFVSHPSLVFNLLDSFHFTGLGANRNLYVQIIGGDQGWFGDILVNANGATIGTWLTVADGDSTTASLYAFDATANALGELTLDLSIAANNYAGIAGIVILGDAGGPSSIPESSAWLFGGLACAAGGLASRIRRRTSYGK
jgi:hypothetical protein